MKIHLTPGAKQQLSIITNIETIRSGFLFGTEIGKHIIVEELFPLNFEKDNIDAVYRQVLEKKGEKLLGPFFLKDKTSAADKRGAAPARSFFNDWFIGDIIMEIGDKKNEFYLYEGEN